MSDVLIVGSGIFGLWCARACRDAGLTVTLADREGVAAGASGGPVGALTPHLPTHEGWTELKALQLAGLTSLPAEVSRLEAETGRATGYARVGRVSPLADPRARERAEAHGRAARDRWPVGATLEVLDAVPKSWRGLVAEEACAGGLLRETLAARIDPPAYAAAVRAGLDGSTLLDGWTLERVERGAAIFDRGRVATAHVVLAAGWETARLLGLDPVHAGVKGQAAVLAADLPGDLPVIQGAGLYVCAHRPGRVGVGSTSEPGQSDRRTDEGLERVIDSARALCPALRCAPVVARWAGVRPRAPRAGPMAGQVPGWPGLWVATGGHKIGLALAHRVGRAIAARIAGLPGPMLPDCVEPAAHGVFRKAD